MKLYSIMNNKCWRLLYKQRDIFSSYDRKKKNEKYIELKMKNGGAKELASRYTVLNDLTVGRT